MANETQTYHSGFTYNLAFIAYPFNYLQGTEGVDYHYKHSRKDIYNRESRYNNNETSIQEIKV